MWTVIYIAPTRTGAEKLQKALNEEGIMVNLRQLTPNTDKGPVEILVPESEAEEASVIIYELLAT